MAKERVLWACSECGHTQAKWTGVCSSCQSWNTFTEEVVFEAKRSFLEKKQNKPISLKDVTEAPIERSTTGKKDLDRLFGGGIVKGSLILIGGEPGIGKSTLLLQLADSFTKTGKKVLYVCGEESVEQTSLRAKRLHIAADNLFLFHETALEVIQREIETLSPDIVIIDSVQIIYKSDIPSSPGSIVQVREVALHFLQLAKGYGITVFLIGHVTKGGEIAGPRVLEHLVDVVLEFEGERKGGFRLLRSLKNRFGPTDDLALFQMKNEGLEEILNPSALFLQKRQRETPGCAIVSTVDGQRAYLIEIQALVTNTVYPSPSRKSTGLDPNRLALLLAVLEKQLGYPLYRYDVFVSVAGGMKITEPAIDLGVLLAIASSFTGKSIDSKTVVFGEVGLAGEIRSVSRVESRMKEAKALGFLSCIYPKENILENKKPELSLHPFEHVEEAISFLL